MIPKNNEDLGHVDEKPKDNFTGWFIPIQIVNLFNNGTISMKDMILLALINGLASLDRGCFAGNEYLAMRMKTSIPTIKRQLLKLKKLELLEQTGFDGRTRYLETRLPDTPARQTAQNQSVRQLNNDPSDGLKMSHRVIKVNSKEEVHSLSTLSSADGNSVSSTLQTSQSLRKDKVSGSNNNSKKKTKQPTIFDQRAADELEKIISRHIKVNCKSNKRDWANQFRLMRERDKVPKEEIRKTIEWYADHINDEYAIEAYSARAFRDKFKLGKFAGAMQRSRNGSNNNHQFDNNSNDENDPSTTLDHMKRVVKVSKWFKDHGRTFRIGTEFPTWEEVNEALEDMGMEPNSVHPQFI